MDSPTSENIQTRFSTPVSELDDHRRYSTSGQRPEIGPSPQAAAVGCSRHASHRLRTSLNTNRPILDLAIANEALTENGTVVRDFEEAVIDDDKSGIEPATNNLLVPDFNTPSRSRRPTLRLPEASEEIVKTRSGSQSSRSSSSAPNSVDAFADPRRRERAGTVNSKTPSDVDVRVIHTASTISHQRRPTFSNESARLQKDIDACSYLQDRGEDDAGYPIADDTNKAFVIDFEVLEEFVAEKKNGNLASSLALDEKQLSDDSVDKAPRVFNDLRPDNSQNAPKILADDIEAGIPLDEKHIGLSSQDQDHPKLNHSLTSRRANTPDISRFSFFSSELESTIHAAELGDLIMPGETFRDIFDLGLDGGVWWLDMCNPTASEVDAICKAFSVHPLTNEDIKTQEAREKVELFKQYYFVCFRSFYQMDKNSEDYMDPVNVYMVVFREGVLSFTFCQSPHAVNVRRRIGELRDYFALSSDWICYAMIDNIVDCFGPVIRDIERETDVIEDQVFVARAEDFASLLRQIGECRRKSLGLMRLLSGKADVIKGFAKRCNSQHEVTPRGEIGLYLGDIQDHVVTMLSTLGHAEKMLSRSHANYLAQVSVDNLVQGNRANVVLSKITLIATIIVPLNLICGLFGMNVPVPGRSSDGLGWFFGILGVIVALTGCCLLGARRIKFI